MDGTYSAVEMERARVSMITRDGSFVPSRAITVGSLFAVSTGIAILQSVTAAAFRAVRRAWAIGSVFSCSHSAIAPIIYAAITARI